VIEIHPHSHDPSAEFKVDSQNEKKISTEKDEKLSYETKEKKPLFRIDLPGSIIESQRFYYKDVELNNLKKDLDFILIEIEKEVDKLLI
jgi:hypothetical protein